MAKYHGEKGQKIGGWEIVSFPDKPSRPLCRCVGCGVEKIQDMKFLATRARNGCRSCASRKIKENPIAVGDLLLGVPVEEIIYKKTGNGPMRKYAVISCSCGKRMPRLPARPGKSALCGPCSTAVVLQDTDNRNFGRYKQRVRKLIEGGYYGVHQTKQGSYCARIHKNGIDSVIGIFDKADDAARAYDARAMEMSGDSAILNFPGEYDAAP